MAEDMKSTGESTQYHAQAICVPGENHNMMVPCDRPLPCIVIFVHGVNSEGEWYGNAEDSIAKGLNTRLGRTDIVANEYAKGARQLQKLRRSPVIRFYWGYRAPQDQTAKGVFPYRIALKSRQKIDEKDGVPTYKYSAYSHKYPAQNDEQAKYYWGGGPFQNGTDALNTCWLGGFDPDVMGIDIGSPSINPERDRPLNKSPDRDYYIHAAKRLAKLIDEVRSTYKNDTIAVVSHSQGTMIASLAMFYVKTRVPDTLFLCNSPYSFEDKFTDAAAIGDQVPTAGSRVTTFYHLLDKFKARTPSADELEGVGGPTVMLNGKPTQWSPAIEYEKEHANHGRVFVYCCPHDRVMGSTPLESIGWKGVQRFESGDYGARFQPFADYQNVLYQRQFMRSSTVGNVCGDIPRYANDGNPVWMPPSPKVAGIASEHADISKSETVYVNGPMVPHPVTLSVKFNETKDFNGDGTVQKISEAGDYEYFKELIKPVWVDDPAFPGEEAHRTRHLETPAEVQHDMEHTDSTPTNHSTILRHSELVANVLTYDLPIGCAESAESPFGNSRMSDSAQ
ncbi:hypothetical protein HFK89_23750 [Ralstonia pseudosolanacearum]|uniref:T6SS effector phospholipase Tle3 domain-containing protein n=1 Tax=Ralstonia pseudosolanacearum TaxID=1310165 RepID=UPI0008F893A0|nr:hypothetical protein [Ralstonia pseudosolanacearum]MCK4165378.1 hypothetical protein [Ralstonia pseudosolanacearum]OIN68876.1 hypothetical protein BL248_22705 [Ralstonia solanacearum]